MDALGQANYLLLRGSLFSGALPGFEAKKGGGNRLSMTAKKVVYKLDSTLESVNEAEQKASELASGSGFDEDEVLRIEMAVREAAVNAVYHGNGYDPNKKVTLAFERTEKDLIITVADEGHGLD